MKQSATWIITVTHISEVSLFSHDLLHLNGLKTISSSAVLLGHCFNRICTESAGYLKEYNTHVVHSTQTSVLPMVFYFLHILKAWTQKRLAWIQIISSTYSFPISNSFDLVVLLEPPRANEKLREPDSPISVHVLYVLRIYSWRLQIKTDFPKACSLTFKILI